MFEKLTELLDGYLKVGVPGNDCIVYQKGKCVYRRTSGYSNWEKKIPMNGKERYNIYSCTKMMTCTAALMLYEKGMYQLDDKLSKYMPEFETMYIRTQNGVKKAENSIRIRNLFNMTAGFSYDLNSPQLQLAKKETAGKCPTRKTMEYLAREPLLFEPGAEYNYSLCHDVLAALVEVLSGERFADYMKKYIFEPAGMVYSAFHLPEEELDSMAEQYSLDHETGILENCGKGNAFMLGSEYDSGGAGCISTVEDYIRFLEAMRKGLLLKPETMDLMSTNSLFGLPEKQYKDATDPNYGYGLGVRCPFNDQKTDVGWGGAAGAYLALDRPCDITVYYSQHVLGNTGITTQNSIIDLVKEELV